MTVEAIATAQYTRQQQIAAAAAAEVEAAWRTIDPDDIRGSFVDHVLGRLLEILVQAQLLAAGDADRYVDTLLVEQGIAGDVAGELIVQSLAGVASDGRPLDTLLASPVVEALHTISRGGATEQGLAAGLARLVALTGTQVADAGRAAVSVATTGRPAVAQYVRMLRPPACARCVLLAGKVYRWSTAFLRHPLCKCLHIPVDEDHAGDLRTDPAEYLESIDELERERILGKAGAEAYADGADLGQLVNARRGVTTATAYGRRVRATTEGTTRRGFYGVKERARLVREGKVPDEVRRAGSRYVRLRSPRLMPEEIYRLAADDRAEAVRLLKRNGFLSDHNRPRSLDRSKQAAAPAPRPEPAPVSAPALPAPAPRLEPAAPMTAAEAKTWAKATYPGKRDLPADQLEAARLYSGGAYSNVNKFLRTGQIGPSNRGPAQEVIDGVDKLLKANPTRQTVVVHRAVELDALGGKLPGDLVGKTLTEKGFMSTTIGGKEVGGVFKRKPVQMTITVPPGVPSMFMDPLSLVKGERELLLGRGLKWRVNSARQDPRTGRWTVEAEIIPAGGRDHDER